MAGRSQHRDDRSSYFSSDLGRSGVYDGVNGTPINFSQRGDNPNDLRNIEGISETARESGLYASRIGSTKQPSEDYSKEGMLGSTGNFPRQNWDQSFEEGNRTPDSGTYSRNIESNQYDTDYKANNDIGRSSTFDNNRDSGLYSRKIGSFRETIPENSGKDNQRQSSKHFKPNKYMGNTLDTMLEGEDESKQPEHFHSTNYSESRQYAGTARNGDYDGHSNASFQDDKEFPPWAGMMVEQQFTDKYIKTKWPRISLHLTQPRHSDPFVPGKIDEGSIHTLDEKSGKDDHKTRNTLCVIGLGTLLLCLVGAAIITVILLANQSTDKTEYVKVNMTVTVQQTFTAELNDPNSPKYKLFATEFCKQTKDVYTSANITLSGYYGCKVSNLENGSIIVTFIIYFTGTTNQKVTPEAVKTILDTHLNVSSSKLGDLEIETDSVIVYNVETETLSSPPPVEELVTTTTTVITTPRIETTTEVVVPSTVTTLDSETVHTTEATTLNTKQTTTETNSLTTSSTEATTPKTVQTTTETAISTVPTTEDTTTEAKKSTMKTTTPTTPSTEDTTTESKQATIETTTSTAPPTEDTTTEPNQATMETTTSTAPPTEDTTTESKQATMETTTSKVPLTEDTTTETVESTTEPTSSLISSTEETTPNTVQSIGETSTPSVSLTDETTPKTMHSTTKIITASSSSTENTTPKTMQTETTSPIIDSTVKPMSSQSTNHVSEVTTTLQTDMATEATQETTSGKTSPTQDSISSTTQDEPTTMTSTITTSSTKSLSDTATPDSTVSTTTSSSVPLIDTTQPVISTSTDDTNQLITSPPTEDTTKLITSTSTEETTSTMPSTSTDYTTHAEDTTKPTTSTSTEESTTKLITSTSTDDTTKPVSFTSTDDTTATLASTATLETTKHVTSTPTEDTTKTISSAKTEDTTPTITAISTEDTTKLVTSTPTEDTTTKTVSSIPTEGTTLSITATSTSMSTTGTTTSDEITTVSGTTTESQNIGLNCTDSLNGILYSGPVATVCIIQKSYQFDYIRISHDEGSNNSIYGILLNKDGTAIKNFVENQDINVKINSTSTLNLVLTFVNVSCAMDGVYKVALISNMSGEMKESVSRKIQLEVSSPAEKPILTLSADQVIDLIFNDDPNDYYRANGKHRCEGYVGRPPSNLELNITYDNGTRFDMISNTNINLDISAMSNGCRNKEVIEFGLRFSQDMVGAKIRCGVKDSINDFTLSEELSLIPRNICSCGETGKNRGHPNNCRVYVLCEEAGGIMYPTGFACPSNLCRNSITGKCTANCSNSVCEETVPTDFCTTPAPPTTTPAPSPYIFCTDTAATVNSGPTVITCYLNDTATFTVMNVTYTKLGESAVQQIALIDDSDAVDMFAMEDIVYISSLNNIINITILNPLCENEGTFAVVTFINGESVMAQGKFSVISKPSGNATLQLHPDQIAGLDAYRPSFLHICEINVGYPPGEIIIEMLKQGAAEFQKLNVDFHTHVDRVVDNTTCSITRTAPFGILFTSDMDMATIRCTVSHDLFSDDQLVYSNNETVSLVPIDFCKNNTEARSYHPHPTNCYSFVQCEVDVTYSKPCQLGQCFGVTETIGCEYCHSVTCPADITTTPVPDSTVTTAFIEESTTPVATFSNDVNCNSSTVVWNSGPVDMKCKVNSSIFSFLNVTYRASSQSIPTVISVIQSNEHVNDLNQYDGITVTYVEQLVTISIFNASCSSGDFYGVIVEDMHGNVDGKAEGKLIVGSNPSDNVTLKLHPDQIAGLGTYRTDNPHICEADIGYPGGEIKIEILKQGETEFQVLDVIIADTENNDSSCSITQKLSFGILFTNDMEKATLRCRVKSNLFPDEPLIYSNNETVSIIPSDFCEGTTSSFNPHITNCHSYIWCVGNVEHGKPCKSNLCFGIYQTNVCDFCRNAICPSEITTTSTPETTVPVPSIDVSCSDSTILINTGPGVIVCSVNATSFSMMNVTYRTSPGLNPTRIAVIRSDASVEDTDSTDLIEVTYTSFTVSIAVLNVSCAHEGYYGVIIDSESGLKGTSQGKLSTSVHQSGPVDFVMNYDQIIDSSRTSDPHTCSGQVGNPPGKIEVEILFDGANDFQTLSFEPSHLSSISTTTNCMVTTVIKYRFGYTSAMYNATIRCKVMNEEFQNVSAIYSKNETLTPVPNNFCDINYNGTYSYPNPADPCNRFVTCIEKTPYGYSCPKTNCFNPGTGRCGHCYEVDSCS